MCASEVQEARGKAAHSACAPDAMSPATGRGRQRVHVLLPRRRYRYVAQREEAFAGSRPSAAQARRHVPPGFVRAREGHADSQFFVEDQGRSSEWQHSRNTAANARETGERQVTRRQTHKTQTRSSDAAAACFARGEGRKRRVAAGGIARNGTAYKRGSWHGTRQKRKNGTVVAAGGAQSPQERQARLRSRSAVREKAPNVVLKEKEMARSS